MGICLLFSSGSHWGCAFLEEPGKGSAMLVTWCRGSCPQHGLALLTWLPVPWGLRVGQLPTVKPLCGVDSWTAFIYVVV